MSLGLFISMLASAQKADKEIYNGNEFYKKQQFDRAEVEYKKALSKNPGEIKAAYNLGNSSYRQKKFEDAAASFDNIITSAEDKKLQQQAYYNKGVAMARQQKLEESIEAWKEALKLEPTDKDSRENLEKALRELKKKQEQEQKQKKDKQDQKKDQQKKDKEKEQPQKPQSKLSQQRVEQLLRALQQKEKEVSNKLNQVKVASPNKPEKDW